MTRAAAIALGVGLCLTIVALLLPPRSSTAPRAQAPGESAAAAASTPTRNEPDLSGPRRESIAPTDLPRSRLEGRVADPSGHAIAGASLRLIVHHGGAEPAELARTRSREDGCYTVDLARVRAMHEIDRLRVSFVLDTSASGYLPADPARLPGVNGDRPVVRQDVVLQPGAVVVGRVVDERGQPVEGATVTLRAGEEEGEVRRSFAWTDDDGRYCFALPDARPLQLDASRSDLGHDRLDGLAPEAGRDFTAPDLVLRPIAELGGVAVYPDGQPVAGAALDVVSTDESGDESSRGEGDGGTVTGADGSFRFRALRPGNYRLYVTNCLSLDERYTSTAHTGQLDLRFVVDLHRIFCHVRAPDGHELLDSGVDWNGWHGERTASFRNLTVGVPLPREMRDSDLDVAYVGGDEAFVPPSTWLWLQAYEPQGYCGEAILQAIGANELHVALALRPIELTARLRLAPRGSTTVPMGGACLEKIVPGFPGRDLEPVSSDGSGFFRCPPGRFLLSISPSFEMDSSRYLLWMEREVELTAGSETLVEYEFRAGGRVRLTVQAPPEKRSEPIRDLELSVTAPGGDSETLAWRGERGSHEAMPGTPLRCFPCLLPGPYALTVRAPGFQPVTVPVAIEVGRTTDVAVSLDG